MRSSETGVASLPAIGSARPHSSTSSPSASAAYSAAKSWRRRCRVASLSSTPATALRTRARIRRLLVRARLANIGPFVGGFSDDLGVGRVARRIRNAERHLLAQAVLELLLADALDLDRDVHEFAEVTRPARRDLSASPEMLLFRVRKNRSQVQRLPERK